MNDSFILYTSYYALIEGLTDEQLGQLTNNDKLALKLAPGGGACLVIKKTPSMRVGEQAAFPLVSPSWKIGRE